MRTKRKITTIASLLITLLVVGLSVPAHAAITFWSPQFQTTGTYQSVQTQRRALMISAQHAYIKQSEQMRRFQQEQARRAYIERLRRVQQQVAAGYGGGDTTDQGYGGSQSSDTNGYGMSASRGGGQDHSVTMPPTDGDYIWTRRQPAPSSGADAAAFDDQDNTTSSSSDEGQSKDQDATPTGPHTLPSRHADTAQPTSQSAAVPASTHHRKKSPVHGLEGAFHEGVRDLRREIGKDYLHPYLRQQKQAVLQDIRDYATGQ